MHNNVDFLRAVYGELSPDEHGWTCSFRASPNTAEADWTGSFFQYGGYRESFNADPARLNDNNYFSIAVMQRDAQGKAQRRKENFKRLAALLADDVVLSDLLGTPTWTLKTSTGKHQVGATIQPDDPDAHNSQLVDRLMQEMVRQQFVKADKSGNNAVRYARQPYGTNTKTGERTELIQWAPENTFTLADAAALFGIDLDALRLSASTPAPTLTAPVEQGSDWNELLAGFTNADAKARSYHDSLLRFTGKLAAAGTSSGAIVNLTRALMAATQPTDAAELARWQVRFDEVPRMAQGASKFAPPVPSPVSINLPLAGSQSATEAPGVVIGLEQLERASSATRWLVKDAVPADSLGILFGASGTYKSFVALDLALHLANGMSWLGKRTAQVDVVYVALEGGAGIWRRVKAWHQHHGLPLSPNLRVCILPLLLSEPGHMKALTDALEASGRPPGLVVIDTLAQASNCDENDASEVSAMLRTFNQELRAKFNASVLLIHHSGHMATERPRGSSALTANTDFVLGVFRPDPQAMTCQLEVHKQKDSEKLPPALFDMAREVVGSDNDGDEVSSLVAKHNGAVAAFVQRVRLGRYDQALLESLEKAPEAVPETALRALIVQMCGNPETGRKSFQRSMGTLREQHLITQVAPGMWAATQKKGPP